MGRTQAGRPVPRPDIAFTREFDFWLGEWDVSWDGDKAGTSSVYCDFDDRVIVESFDGRPSSEVQGMSLSTYDEPAGLWRLCWVDSSGRFTVASGGFDGEAMDLRTEGEPIRRARWQDITGESFRWTLEESHDGCRTWELVRELHYTRVL